MADAVRQRRCAFFPPGLSIRKPPTLGVGFELQRHGETRGGSGFSLGGVVCWIEGEGGIRLSQVLIPRVAPCLPFSGRALRPCRSSVPASPAPLCPACPPDGWSPT